MKKIISAMLSLLVLLNVTRVDAQESLIRPMKEGDFAPFEGLLLNPPAVAKIISDKNYEPERIKIEVDKAVSYSTSTCKFQLNKSKIDCEERLLLLNAQISGKDSQIIALDKQLKDSDEKLRKSLEAQRLTPAYVIAGFFTGAAAAVLTTYAIVKATE